MPRYRSKVVTKSRKDPRSIIEAVETYRGTTSLPFPLGKHQRIAVKIVDDRDIESLKIVDVEPPA